MTERQREILERMAAHPDDDEGELVMEGREAWLDLERTSPALVFSLLRLMVISAVHADGKVGGVERYRINETGRNLLAALAKGEK